MDTITLLAIAAFLLVGVVTFAVGVVLVRLAPGIRADRLAAVPMDVSPAAASILRWEADPASGWRRLVERIGGRLTPGNVALLAGYRRRLMLAGFHDPRAIAVFLGSKATLGILTALLYTLYGAAVHRALPNVVPISIMLGGIGFFVPDVWLRFRTARRQHDMVNALPDVLDLMMVCVEAGMGFDAAVARITQQADTKTSPFHQELLRMHLEMRAGRPREESLRAFADRVGTPELKSVVTAFIQSERLGTPLGKTLRIQAEASRVRRRHRAEARAQLAPLMMLFPTILFLMPAFMIVAMAPPMLKMLELMQHAGK